MPEYEGYKYGEMSVNFIIDLNKPETIRVKQSGEELEQTTLTAVGNEPSTLPDIKAIERRYFQLVGISKLIAWANVNDIRKNIDLIPQLADISGEYSEYLADAVQETLKMEVPFSGSYTNLH